MNQGNQTPTSTTSRSDLDDVTWERLEDQLAWYESKSTAAKNAFIRWKLVELVLAASIPVAAALDLGNGILAALGSIVVVLEGLQHLFQWQTNWTLYRSTAEALKHEKFLFLARGGPYTEAHATRILAERLEGLVSQEHATWTDSRGTTVPAQTTSRTPISD